MGNIIGGDRTDLALELNESVDKEDTAYSGVKVREYTDGVTGIKITTLTITSREGERLFGKEMGTYITIEAQDCCHGDDEYDSRLAGIVSHHLRDIIEPIIVNNKSILVIGLGNRDITADSLGPRVVDGLLINRHIIATGNRDIRLSALIPGVMAQTGMETSQIVKGIVNTSKPGVVIVVDALAAMSVKHLNKTFQISDRGINPGSGVGNHRDGITAKTIGVPVVALGLPTVIEMNSMFVTPKDVDVVVQACAEIMAEAINEVVYS
jgi:spore protease